MSFARHLRIIAPITIVMALTTVTTAGTADVTSDARAAINAAYEKMNAAASRKDLKSLLAFYSKDYIATDPSGGKQTLSDYRRTLEPIFQRARSIRATTTIQKLSVKSNRAVAVIKDRTRIVLGHPRNPRMVTGFVVDATREDVWVKGPKGWLQQRAKVLSTKQGEAGF
jgi:ketosteroid isomerase-like protein